MIAHVCGLDAGEFVHTIGDTHVYQNHVDALQEQVRNKRKALLYSLTSLLFLYLD